MKTFILQLKKYVKTRFFIVVASVAAVLLVFSAVFSFMGRQDIIRSAVNLVASPFKSLASACGSALDGFADYFGGYDKLKAENEALRKENEELKLRIDYINAAKAENEWLRDFVIYAAENENIKLLDVRKNGENGDAFHSVYSINKGTNNGVGKNYPVISGSGLVGFICEAGIGYAKVQTIIDGSTSVGVICERTGAVGTLEGGVVKEDGGVICRMICPDGGSELETGDLIVTSGKGSVYPYGIAAGRVISVKRDEYSRKLIAEIEPLVDFSKLDRMMVILPRGDE